MTGSITIPRGSVEYVTATVTLTNPPGAVLGAQTVTISIRPDTNPPTAHVWLPATWVGATPAATRQARTTSPVTFDTAGYPARTYWVFVRLVDNPETPILQAGTITIT